MAASGTALALFSFTGGDDGGPPLAGLVQGADGSFYGTAVDGGSNSFGTVFKMTAAGAVTPLHAFGGNDGAFPYAALVQGADGNFYGTTAEGGSNYAGNIFKMNPAGEVVSLYTFSGTNDGDFPLAALIQGTDGNLYGTTYEGGSARLGTVFKVTTNGTLTTLHSFNYADGAYPFAGLVQGPDGNLYGTTERGGLGGAGTVFKITTNGALGNPHLLHRLQRRLSRRHVVVAPETLTPSSRLVPPCCHWYESGKLPMAPTVNMAMVKGRTD